MKFKQVFAALSGSGKKSSSKASRRQEASENASDSPLVPKRLLTPGSGLVPSSSLRGRSSTLADVTHSGTPRALNYDRSPTRARLQQREPGLVARSSPRQAQAAAPTPVRSTPARSRFGQQAAAHEGAALGSTVAYDGAAGADPAACSDNIRVVLRLRPRNEREQTLGGGTCVQPQGNSAVRVASHPEPHSFSFDYVAGDGTDQETIFQVAGKPIVENCLGGYNGCIFAYGQTGSGKTYTMLGSGDGSELVASGSGTGGGRGDASHGLIQRVFEHLFARIAESGGKHLLECSFLEIYNETITDLLDPSRTNLQVRENLEGQYVSNLTAHEVYRVEDVVALLRTGQANRRVGETNMNERSSRSHSVFTCKLQSKTVDSYGATHIRTARLHLVDLAGSERQKASGAQGERLKEATAINKSLSALGNVIMSLVDQQHGRARHIPYRDSRLTYLLQDSLGGNAKTCLVATVSPATVNVAETLSTLRFADQAKRIRNQAVVNEDTDGDREALKREIKRLQDEVNAAKRALAQAHYLTAAGAAPGGAAAAAAGAAPADPLSGTPARLAATADAMMAATSPSTGEGLGRRQALMGALRREDVAVKDAKRLEAELEGMRGLIKAKDSDLQRSQMMMKLKESRLSRLQSGVADVPEEVAELHREIELLRAKVEAHPEVKRFAVENLRLSEEVRRYEGIVHRQELAALHTDVDVLRGEMLRLEEEMQRAQGEAAMAAEQAAAARAEAELAAESIRAKAVEETQAKAAVELSQLRQQLFEQQCAAREAEGQLCTAARDNEELQARVALLQAIVDQLESNHNALRGELSPVKRQARQFEHELGLARQETMTAEMRASSEATLRSQSELSSQQVQARLVVLEAEAATLRASNQELLRAKTDAEEQCGAAASVEVDLAALRAELQREQAAAAERQASHADALAQLDSSRQRAVALEAEVQATQREVQDAQTELQRQQAEQQVERAAAAAAAAAALKAADEMQTELESRGARVQELQAAQEKLQVESDELAQRCTQLHNENVHLTSMLAQRDNELLEMEQTMEESDAQLAQQKEAASKLAGELEDARAALAAKSEELANVGAELESGRAQLAQITAAMQDAHDQLAELQERLAAAEELQAQAEYELSDKSASLAEVQEQLSEVKRQLESVCAVQAAVAAESEARLGSSAEHAAAELQAAHARAAELAVALAAVEAAVQAERQGAEAAQAAAQEAQAAVQEAQAALAAKEQEVAAQRVVAETAQQKAGSLEAQLQQLQQVTLLEKEQQLLLGRAEAKELREQLAAQEEETEKLRVQLEARDGDIAQLRHEMATEVGEAAQQVQLLLAAQGRVAALEAELAAAEEKQNEYDQLPLKMAEAVAAARGDARAEIERLEQLLTQREDELAEVRHQFGESQAAIAEAATMTTTQAQEQIEQLVAEREAWIEEVQTQRAEASSAVESCRALERRCAELSEERSSLTAALTEVQERAGKLESELTHLTGQQNLNQRIQYHKKVKEENDTLREELGRLRIDHHRVQVRYDRVAGELQKLRVHNGQDGLPDFEAEEALRDALAATEAQKHQLETELQSLAQALLAHAPRELRQPQQHGAPAGSAAGEEGEGDIVLELCTPRGPPSHADGGSNQAGAANAGPTSAASAARRALADILAQHAATLRSLEDHRQQVRLLKESSKLARLRRTSSVVAAAAAVRAGAGAAQ